MASHSDDPLQKTEFEKVARKLLRSRAQQRSFVNGVVERLVHDAHVLASSSGTATTTTTTTTTTMLVPTADVAPSVAPPAHAAFLAAPPALSWTKSSLPSSSSSSRVGVAQPVPPRLIGLAAFASHEHSGNLSAHIRRPDVARASASGGVSSASSSMQHTTVSAWCGNACVFVYFPSRIPLARC